MVTTIASITVIKEIAATTSTFLPDDRLEVEAQTAASGRSTLVEFMNPGYARPLHGIVGKNASGDPMISADHLIAKPCPPFCPHKKEAYAVAYP